MATTVQNADGSTPVAVTSSALPTGASTSAAQTTGNASLASIDGKITAVNTGAVVIASGTVTAVTAITNALPAGTNNIGDVDVLTLPALVAGTANIGDVDVLTVPADPFGVNADAASATGSISAKLRFIAGTGIPITGTVTVGSHAVTNAGTFAVQSAAAGDVASDAVDSGNPVKVGAIAKSADITAVADADRVNLVASLLGKLLTLPYATPAKTWNYAAAAGGLVSTVGVTAKAAAAAGVRNYITRVQAINSHQTIGSEIVIRDGAAGTVLWRGWAQAAGGGCAAVFDPPLRGTAATLVEIAEVTATATAGVLVSLQGFEAAE